MTGWAALRRTRRGCGMGGDGGERRGCEVGVVVKRRSVGLFRSE